MKRHIKKNILSAVVSIVLLIMCLSGFCGCAAFDEWLTSGWTVHGPYHHEALPLTPTQVIQVKDNFYTIFNRDLYILREDGFECLPADYTTLGGTEIQTDGEKLYINVSTYHVSKSGIGVFSSDLEYEGLILNGVGVRSFLVHDNLIYIIQVRITTGIFSNTIRQPVKPKRLRTESLLTKFLKLTD